MFKYLKAKLNGFVTKIFFPIYIQISNELKNENWSKIKNLKNVFIDETVHFGEHSDIVVHENNGSVTISKGVSCRKFCNFLIYPNASLMVGEDVFFNNYCSVNCLSNIEIGPNTIFGEGVKLYDHNHSFSVKEGKLITARNDFKLGPIKIGRDCWIGSNVTILQGVVIGDNVIIGAHNLIFKSIPSNSLIKANTSYCIIDNPNGV